MAAEYAQETSGVTISTAAAETRQKGEDDTRGDWPGNPVDLQPRLEAISDLYGILSNVPLERSLYSKLHEMLGAEIKQLDMAWNGCQGQGQGHEAKTNLDSHGQSEKLSAVADAALPATKLPEPEVFLRAVSAVESMAKSTGSIEGRVSEIVKLLHEKLPMVPIESVVRSGHQDPAATESSLKTSAGAVVEDSNRCEVAAGGTRTTASAAPAPSAHTSRTDSARSSTDSSTGSDIPHDRIPRVPRDSSGNSGNPVNANSVTPALGNNAPDETHTEAQLNAPTVDALSGQINPSDNTPSTAPIARPGARSAPRDSSSGTKPNVTTASTLLGQFMGTEATKRARSATPSVVPPPKRRRAEKVMASELE